jgi:BirA family biotin operon repressor/biotin-[acetyl-CoA-carboxylase] ligase
LSPFIQVDRILAQTFVAAVESLPTVPSTNDWAKQRAAEPACRLPLLVVAQEQTAGRGRGANRWWSAAGSLTFSLAWEPERSGIDLGQSPLVSLAVAVAVAEATAALASGRAVGIHWPNDVMAECRKLAGILVEVLANRRYVLGIGVNLNNTLAGAPPEVQGRAVTLRDLTGAEYDPTDVLVELLQRVEQRILQLAAAPADLVARANALCLQRGQTLRLRWGDELITGRCAGIAPDGSLLVDTPHGRRAFASGVLC